MKAEGAENLNVKIFREICPPTIPALWTDRRREDPMNLMKYLIDHI